MPLTKTELKDIQSLQTKKGRKLRKKFLAEGVRLLEEAARHAVRPEMVCFAEAALSERGRSLVDRFQKLGLRMESLHLRQMDSIADTEETQGILATFPLPGSGLAELYRPTARRVLLCENISDPGNLGTLLRSAKAFGFDLVVLTGRSADPFSPKVVRASAGSIFGLSIAEAGIDELLALAIRHRICLLATDIHGLADLANVRKLTKGRGLMLAVGSEADGLSTELLDNADARIRIAHATAVESLNAAVAGSILMHELYNLSE